VIDVFKSNNIDGEELLSLTKETLSSELHIGKMTSTHYSILVFVSDLALDSGCLLYACTQFRTLHQ